MEGGFLMSVNAVSYSMPAYNWGACATNYSSPVQKPLFEFKGSSFDRDLDLDRDFDFDKDLDKDFDLDRDFDLDYDLDYDLDMDR